MMTNSPVFSARLRSSGGKGSRKTESMVLWLFLVTVVPARTFNRSANIRTRSPAPNSMPSHSENVHTHPLSRVQTRCGGSLDASWRPLGDWLPVWPHGGFAAFKVGNAVLGAIGQADDIDLPHAIAL